jgi:hypothetical protein
MLLEQKRGCAGDVRCRHRRAGEDLERLAGGRGEDVEARLTTSYDEVLAQRQAELVGRAFDIKKTEAVQALMPLAENYLSSAVFRRVTVAQAIRNSKLEIPDSQSAIQNPQSSPGLWSELRFRLRRPNGILTGTIDKLLITPAANGKGVDVEIIDFKTNRFSLPARATQTQLRTAVTTRATQVKVHANTTATATGQGMLNFESMTEDVVTEDVGGRDASIEDQVKRVADDYRLQMQGYALALRELLPADVRINSLRATLHFIDPQIEFSVPASLLDADICARNIDEAIITIALLEGTLDADQFPPLPATHCRTCNFVDMCPAGKEWLRINELRSSDQS